MLIALLGLIIGFFVGIYLAHKTYFRDWIEYIVYPVLFSLLGLVFGMVIVIPLPMDTYIKSYSYNIENLQDNNSINGSFFIGCGNIEGKMKYVFYYKLKGDNINNEEFKMMQINSDLTIIRYTDKTLPKVIVNEILPVETDKSFINYFAIDLNIGDKTYIIEVPKGSIKQNYNLDAQ
jgi:hypothetical protein